MDDSAIIAKIGKKRYRRRQERERYHTTSIDYNTLNSMASSTSSSGKLAQEIHDEFLSCKICLEGFKNPKCLDCLHTFCEQCIENHVMSECTYKKYSDYREFTCPLCRKRTQLPLGGVKKLPDNFLVSSLSELVARQRPSKFPFCDICKLVSRKHREAASKCLDCNKLLCKQCVDLHKETKVTKNHSIFDVDIEKDIECKEHKEEAVRFYCEKCETCICVLCTFNEHKDHEITQFNDAVIKYKETIQNLLDNCKEKIVLYDEQLTTLTKCDSLIKAAEQSIRDSAIQFISDVRNREKELIDELHQMYGAEMMNYVEHRNEMQVNLDSLKSTCNLTEVVLRGKDIELLLLKKQVQEKLSALNGIEMKNLPESVKKQVTFIPGTMDLGRLQDLDQPNKYRVLRSVSTASSWREGSNRTTYSQTDETLASQKSGMIDGSTQTVEEEADNNNNVSSDDKSTETEIVETQEKAVNTRSRSLSSLTHQLQSTARDESMNNENNEQNSSQTVRRHRRRRERPKPIEVTSRPTTSNLPGTTYAVSPYLSYSSSIDENYYSPDSQSSNTTQSPP
ncbi:hypothetical protein CHS0354_017121 [Potamilus streckersoni]|uniref:Uncharacterized protein n=1 Tax=Potamilus streckersoni TaxID=2493646 RepID=A0AAE0VSM4_9BIVA|nr:hypothetical protein CHS0354_017121 [Potamilus streckersoni]